MKISFQNSVPKSCVLHIKDTHKIWFRSTKFLSKSKSWSGLGIFLCIFEFFESTEEFFFCNYKTFSLYVLCMWWESKKYSQLWSWTDGARLHEAEVPTFFFLGFFSETIRIEMNFTLAFWPFVLNESIFLKKISILSRESRYRFTRNSRVVYLIVQLLADENYMPQETLSSAANRSGRVHESIVSFIYG